MADLDDLLRSLGHPDPGGAVVLRADHAPVSGRVYEVARKKGPQFYAKWRDADGQHQRRLGPHWTGRGATPPGYLRRCDAEELLAELLVEARHDAARRPRQGMSFEDVAEDWMRWGEHERAWKPTTVQDHCSALRCHLLPAFAGRDIATITTRDIEDWRAGALADGMTARNANKQIALLHNLFQRARRTCGLPDNPAASVERLRVRYDPSRYDFYSVEEVMALVRAAADEQDGALYLTAAFTGLRRGELSRCAGATSTSRAS
jgi:integrase